MIPVAWLDAIVVAGRGPCCSNFNQLVKAALHWLLSTFTAMLFIEQHIQGNNDFVVSCQLVLTGYLSDLAGDDAATTGSTDHSPASALMPRHSLSLVVIRAGLANPL